MTGCSFRMRKSLRRELQVPVPACHSRFPRQVRLPYARIYMQLEYKLKMKGICLIRQEESYSSQCPPQSEEVSHIYAEKRNRKKRGIYIVDTVIYNADAVGAYNILRKYHAVSGKEIDMPVTGLSSTKTIKVAV